MHKKKEAVLVNNLQSIKGLDPAWVAVVSSLASAGVDGRRVILALTLVDWPSLMLEPLPPDRELRARLGSILEVVR